MPPTNLTLPELPRLVLRVGFAGNRKVPTEVAGLETALGLILETLAQRLAEIAPGPRIHSPAPEPHISRFYSLEPPVLRLVTGLCEGGDTLAAQALTNVEHHPVLKGHVTTELAAVIPFDLPTYRASRPAEFRAEFDRQAARCSYILSLDGRYRKPDPDTPEARSLRARAYRAQSALLLRQVDLVVAVTDPDGDARAGGTMETVRAALDCELPVVFLHTGTLKISLIEPSDDPASTIAGLAAGEEEWLSTLRGWVTTIVADPDTEEMAGPPGATGGGDDLTASRGEKLLAEFFHAPDSPPQACGNGGCPGRKPSGGERLWGAFEGWFRSGRGPKPDPVLEPYATWRARSTSLNYHYAGLYRGAFLLNYFLAAAAVLLAALSLVFLRYSHAAHGEDRTPAGEEIHTIIAAAVGPKEAAPAPVEATAGWLFPTLLLLGAAKLGCVWVIYRNAHHANLGDWNDMAVDYRYLAERLRSMYYLPRIGSFQPPAAAPPQYASRVVRQSAVDWLLDAIVRSISPASLSTARLEQFTFPEGTYLATILKPDPLGLLLDVRNCWIHEQAVYHDWNARTMDRIHTWAENWGKVFNLAVIGFVALDVAIIVLDLSGWLPERWADALHGCTPWLVFLAAVLPAAVASLNGIRFQSECRRLAERSAVMRTILAGRPPKLPAVPPRSRWASIRGRIWCAPVEFVRTLLPVAGTETPPFAPDPTGSKLAVADRLVARITTAQENPASDPAAWTAEVLRLAESVASVLVQEVAEWSVLYAKEVPEP